MSGKPVSAGDIAAWIADSIDGVYDDEAEVNGGAIVALIDGPRAFANTSTMAAWQASEVPGMSIEWGNHWGDASHHDIVHISETGSHVADAHTEAVSDQ